MTMSKVAEKHGLSTTPEILDGVADSVSVSSWYHSGPVYIKFERLDLYYLLDAVRLELIEEYVNKRKRMKSNPLRML